MSLRLRLVAIIGVSLSVLWTAVAVWMFMDVRQQLRSALDERLAASARMVAGLVSRLPPEQMQVGAKSPLPLEVAARDGLACEVSLMHGEVALQPIARTATSPGLERAGPGYATRVFGGRSWRIYVLVENGLRIATADRIDAREALLREIALTAGLPFAAALPGSLLLLWFGVGRGLLPVERIRAALASRRPDADTPLPDVEAPAELRPLMDTIDHLLLRVQAAIVRERRFTDDAAHELRTPLTAIKTHLQVLRLSCKDRELDDTSNQALANAQSGVARQQRTLDQLLLLARVDARTSTDEPVLVDALHAARLAINDASAGGAGRVVLEGLDAPAALSVPEVLLVSALRNLLDNALHHAPASTAVCLRIVRSGEQLRFSILDEGPGMTATERAQAPQRFWRRNARATGSGLGLSIVEAIAKRYGGSLELMQRAGLGLEARLSLPAHFADEAARP